MSITINGTDHDRLASYGLTELSDDVLSFAEFRNERESGYGDDEGEWFAAIDRHTCPDGDIVSVLVYGTHGNDHTPGASHYTTFEVFDPADAEESAEYLRRVREWQAMPERLDSEDEDESEDEPTGPTALVVQTFGGDRRCYGPFPVTIGPDFDDSGLDPEQVKAVTRAAREQGAQIGYCDIIVRDEHYNPMGDPEIAVI